MKGVNKSEEKIFYVYIYIDPRNNSPFYVGKGHKNRYLAHLYSAKNRKANNYKANKIRKIQRETGQNPEIILFKTGLSEDEAFSMEKELIARWGRKDNETGCLLNLTNGGEGDKGRVFSDKHRENLSKANKGKSYRKNYHLSKEHIEKVRQANIGARQNISNSLKGIKRTKEFIANLAKIRKGRKHTKEACLKMSNSAKGKPKSELHKQHLSEANKGKHPSEETKKKRSESLKGRIKSEEECKHISESKKGEKNPMYGKHPSEETKQKRAMTINLRKYYKTLFSYYPQSINTKLMFCVL